MKNDTPISRRRAARLGALALSPFALGALSVLAPLLAPPATAQSFAPSAQSLMAQAAAQEAAGQWETAAQSYGAAAKAYADAGQTAAEADADRKSASMYEKYANALLSSVNAPAAPPAAAPPAPADTPPAPDTTVPETGAAPLPLSRSAIVRPAKNGSLAVAPTYDGVKISIHDNSIQSPSLVVTADGVIHAAFLEQRPTQVMSDIYYRSSADGGKSWTPAKNLSEPIPDRNVGRCRIAADAQGRVYVVWNVSPQQYGTANLDPHGDQSNNLVYRVLSGGAWNAQPIPLHAMATSSGQNVASASYTVATDPRGVVHVFWAADPELLHPEVDYSPGLQAPGVGEGMLMQATLDGATPSAPAVAYMTPITGSGGSAVCDGLDMLSGYVDGAGAPHILALVTPVRGAQGNPFKIIEKGGLTPAVNLPGTEITYWHYAPTLLLDAQGRRHVITMYQASEPPALRDYVVGSDAAPTIIRALKTDRGVLQNFEAFQGPGGRMIAVMDMNDTGNDTDAELYVSESDGGPWSAPVNVTNNSGRMAVHSAATSLHSTATTTSWGLPDVAAATYDRSGHLLLLYVRHKYTQFGTGAFGIELAGGNESIPNLMFLRF